MTAKELKAILEESPDDMPIILARGREGEIASPVYQCGEGLYVPLGPWQGNVFSKREGEGLGQGATLALVLRPVS